MTDTTDDKKRCPWCGNGREAGACDNSFHLGLPAEPPTPTPDYTPEEASRILDEIQESWDAAPCKVTILLDEDTECEKIAWGRDLSDDEKTRLETWAIDKYLPLPNAAPNRLRFRWEAALDANPASRDPEKPISSLPPEEPK